MNNNNKNNSIDKAGALSDVIVTFIASATATWAIVVMASDDASFWLKSCSFVVWTLMVIHFTMSYCMSRYQE